MHLYRRLLKFLRPHIWIFLVGLVFIALTTLTDGASIGMLVPLADKVLGGEKIFINRDLPHFLDSFIKYLNSMPRLKLLDIMGISIVILMAVKGITRYAQKYFMERLGLGVVRDVRNTIFRTYQGLSLEFFIKRKTGNLASRIIYDAGVIKSVLSNTLTNLVFHSFKVIMFTCIIFILNWKLSLTIFLITPFIVLPIIRIGRVLRKVSKWSQEKMADINSTLYETLSGVRVIKAFNMENYEIKKFIKYNQRFFKIGLKQVKRIAAISPISEFFGTIGAVIVLIVGGRGVVEGNLSFGMFLFYLGSLLSLIRPANRLARVHGDIQKALAAAERIFNILDTPVKVRERADAVILPDYNNEITYDNVHFSYDSEKVLENINFNVKKGQMVAIVGPTGAGKSTIVNLLPRFYDPIKGKILVDGKDIQKFTLKSLRDKIAMVTQEIILFNDTVKENIRYGRKEATEEEMISAAKVAFVHDFVTSMPQGYETIIGDRGFRLSGGEKQRIAIARAVLKNAPILILDEATSQLDTASERIVQKAINKLIAHKTVFVIAHRLSTVKRADNILVLNHGKIVQSGNHSTLLKEEGLYKKLHSMQFKNEIS